MTISKPWWKSKTIIIAIVQGLLGLLAAIYAEYPVLVGVGYLAILKSALDVALRTITYEEIR